MPTKRIFAAAALAGALLTSLPLFAEPLTATPATAPSSATVTPNLMGQLSLFSPAAMLAQSAAPAQLAAKAAAADKSAGAVDEDDADGDGMPDSGVSAVAALANDTSDLRKTLIGMAMQLRDIRYVRGGHDPSTGFDCSGFVRYVFAHAIGMKLPTSSASQFLAGLKVKRADMKPGDLVFFKTGSKRHISHVGIYISNGRFIHSPASGKTVQVSSLDESYWARHFAGAKRPTAIAAAASNG